MELILLGLIELAIPLAAAMLSFFVNMVLLLAGLIGSFLGRPARKSEKFGESGPDLERVRLRRRKQVRWARRVLIGASGLLLILISAAVVVDRFYYEPLTRWMLGRLDKTAGVMVDFTRVEGSFLGGEFKFTDLRLRRAEHPVSVFDIQVKSTEVSLSLKNLVRRKIVFDRLNINGVDGFFEQSGRSKKTLKPRWPFQINSFGLTDLKLDYRSRVLSKNLGGTLIVDFWLSEAIKSDALIGNLFFKSHLSGSFEGQPFSIVNTYLSAEKKYKTVWTCQDISTSALASAVGWPFTWFKSGRVDVVVINQVSDDEKALMQMDWNMVFRDFRAQVPSESAFRYGADIWAWPVVNYMNSKSDHLELGFKAAIKPDDLQFATTDDLSQIVIELVVENFKVILEQFKKSTGPAEALRSVLESQKERAGQAVEVEDEADSAQEGKGGRLKSFLKRKAGSAEDENQLVDDEKASVGPE